jgi:hypothetical protein
MLEYAINNKCTDGLLALSIERSYGSISSTKGKLFFGLFYSIFAILASNYYMFKTYGRSKTDNKNLEEKLLSLSDL